VRIKIEVRLKPGHFDPEGDVTAKSLRDLGFPVDTVKVGKVYVLEVKIDDKEKALKLAEDMCKKLLANPVKDDYTIEVLNT